MLIDKFEDLLHHPLSPLAALVAALTKGGRVWGGSIIATGRRSTVVRFVRDVQAPLIETEGKRPDDEDACDDACFWRQKCVSLLVRQKSRGEFSSIENRSC